MQLVRKTFLPRERIKQNPKKKIGDICFHNQKWKGQKQSLKGAPESFRGRRGCPLCCSVKQQDFKMFCLVMRDASRRRMKVERGSLSLVRGNQERVFSREDQFQRLGTGRGDQGVDTRKAVIVSVTGT